MFREGDFVELLNPGTAWFFDPFRRVRVDLVSRLKPWLIHDQLDQIVKSGRLADLAVVLEVQDHQRALVWIDQRFNRVLTPGRYVYWTSPGEVRVEVVETRSPRFEHPELKTLLRHPEMGRTLDITVIERVTRACCSSTAGMSRLCRPARTPSGRGRPMCGSSRWTCGSRRSMWVVRKS